MGLLYQSCGNTNTEEGRKRILTLVTGDENQEFVTR